MEDLVLSCLESRVEENRNLYARFLVGPFLKGDALTVATALRRVLLSSVESIGITALYIQGITHEFSTIVGVRESVLELSLNFGAIVLSYDKAFFQKKSFFDKVQVGYLQVQGPKIIYANHLKLPLGVKLVDPTQYIATVSKKGFIVLKFIVGKRNNFLHQNIGPELHFEPQRKELPIVEEVGKKNIVRAKKTCFYKKGSTIYSLFENKSHKALSFKELSFTNKHNCKSPLCKKICKEICKTSNKPFCSAKKKICTSDLQNKVPQTNLFAYKASYKCKAKFCKNICTCLQSFALLRKQSSADKTVDFAENIAKNKNICLQNNVCANQRFAKQSSFLYPKSLSRTKSYLTILNTCKALTPKRLSLANKSEICKASNKCKAPYKSPICMTSAKLRFARSFVSNKICKKSCTYNRICRQGEVLQEDLPPYLQIEDLLEQAYKAELHFASKSAKLLTNRKFVLARKFVRRFAWVCKNPTLSKTFYTKPCFVKKDTFLLLHSKTGKNFTYANFCISEQSFINKAMLFLPKVMRKLTSTNRRFIKSLAEDLYSKYFRGGNGKRKVYRKALESKTKSFKLWKCYYLPFLKDQLKKRAHTKKNEKKQKKLKFLSDTNVFKSNICLRNVIPLDLISTPVLKVNFVVEIDDEVLYLRQKIRERIILEVWTNGSIHPRQAVHDSSLRLLDMFASFRSVYGEIST